MAKSLNEFIVVLLSAIVTEQRRVRAIFISIVEIIFFFLRERKKASLFNYLLSIILISRGKKYSYVNSFPLTQDLYLPRCNPLSKYSKNDNCDF